MTSPAPEGTVSPDAQQPSGETDPLEAPPVPPLLQLVRDAGYESLDDYAAARAIQAVTEYVPEGPAAAVSAFVEWLNTPDYQPMANLGATEQLLACGWCGAAAFTSTKDHHTDWHRQTNA